MPPRAGRPPYPARRNPRCRYTGRPAPDRLIQYAEARAAGPGAGYRQFPVAQQVGGQGQQQREHMLYHRRCRVVTYVADRDPALPRKLEIHVVGTGGGNADQLGRPGPGQQTAVQRQLVADDDLGRPDPLREGFGTQGVKERPLFETLPEQPVVEVARVDGLPVQEYATHLVSPRNTRLTGYARTQPGSTGIIAASILNGE